MICASNSRSSRGLTAFTEPCVPSGMNAGVSIAPWAVTTRPWRDFESRSFESSSNTRHCRQRYQYVATEVVIRLLLDVQIEFHLKCAPPGLHDPFHRRCSMAGLLDQRIR